MSSIRESVLSGSSSECLDSGWLAQRMLFSLRVVDRTLRYCRLGSALSMLDYVQLGSALSLRTLARLGSTLSLVGAARAGSSLSMMDSGSFVEV